MLYAAADILQDRYARGDAWDLGSVLIVLPGRQAGRRLRQILEQRAAGKGRRLTVPDMVTPADLPERLFTTPTQIAAPTETFFAWMSALRRLGEDDRQRLVPKMTEDDGPLAGAGLAEHVAQARAEMMAEGLTLREAADRCAALPGFRDDARWPALARLEQCYRDALAQAGRADGDDALRAALEAGALGCAHDIFLVGAVDLNATECAMLRRLPSPVVAVIPAPPETQDGFDDVGRLQVPFWHDRPLPLPDDRLHFVEDPAAEARALADQIAGLEGQGPQGEITLGVGDERAAEGLTRRLAALGQPTTSPYGLPLARVRPAALLSAVRDVLHDPRARRFAALVRHPDLEQWLEGPPLCSEGLASQAPTPNPPAAGGPREAGRWVLLDTLDQYLAEHLPERLPTDGLPARLAEAQRAVDTLLAPLQTARALPDWAEPLADLLRTVYGDHASWTMRGPRTGSCGAVSRASPRFCAASST